MSDESEIADGIMNLLTVYGSVTIEVPNGEKWKVTRKPASPLRIDNVWEEYDRDQDVVKATEWEYMCMNCGKTLRHDEGYYVEGCRVCDVCKDATVEYNEKYNPHYKPIGGNNDKSK